MTVPLRTRSDLKAAGRAMAVEAVDVVVVHFSTLTVEEMDDTARTDAASEQLDGLAVNVARSYREAGIPPAWIHAFLMAFYRTARGRLADYSLAARPAAGTA